MPIGSHAKQLDSRADRIPANGGHTVRSEKTWPRPPCLGQRHVLASFVFGCAEGASAVIVRTVVARGAAALPASPQVFRSSGAPARTLAQETRRALHLSEVCARPQFAQALCRRSGGVQAAITLQSNTLSGSKQAFLTSRAREDRCDGLRRQQPALFIAPACDPSRCGARRIPSGRNVEVHNDLGVPTFLTPSARIVLHLMTACAHPMRTPLVVPVC